MDEDLEGQVDADERLRGRMTADEAKRALRPSAAVHHPAPWRLRTDAIGRPPLDDGFVRIVDANGNEVARSASVASAKLVVTAVNGYAGIIKW